MSSLTIFRFSFEKREVMSINTLIYRGYCLILLISFYGCGASQKSLSLSQSQSPLTVNSQGVTKTRVGGALIQFASNSKHKFVKPHTFESLQSPSSVQYLQDFYQKVRSDLIPFSFLLSKKAKSGCKLNTKSNQILTTALAQTLQELKAQVYKVNKNQIHKGTVKNRSIRYIIEDKEIYGRVDVKRNAPIFLRSIHRSKKQALKKHSIYRLTSD